MPEQDPDQQAESTRRLCRRVREAGGRAAGAFACQVCDLILGVVDCDGGTVGIHEIPGRGACAGCAGEAHGGGRGSPPTPRPGQAIPPSSRPPETAVAVALTGVCASWRLSALVPHAATATAIPTAHALAKTARSQRRFSPAGLPPAAAASSSGGSSCRLAGNRSHGAEPTSRPARGSARDHERASPIDPPLHGPGSGVTNHSVTLTLSDEASAGIIPRHRGPRPERAASGHAVAGAITVVASGGCRSGTRWLVQ